MPLRLGTCAARNCVFDCRFVDVVDWHQKRWSGDVPSSHVVDDVCESFHSGVVVPSSVVVVLSFEFGVHVNGKDLFIIEVVGSQVPV